MGSREHAGRTTRRRTVASQRTAHGVIRKGSRRQFDCAIARRPARCEWPGRRWVECWAGAVSGAGVFYFGVAGAWDSSNQPLALWFASPISTTPVRRRLDTLNLAPALSESTTRSLPTQAAAALRSTAFSRQLQAGLSLCSQPLVQVLRRDGRQHWPRPSTTDHRPRPPRPCLASAVAALHPRTFHRPALPRPICIFSPSTPHPRLWRIAGLVAPSGA